MVKWSDPSLQLCKMYIKMLIKLKLSLWRHTGSGGAAPPIFSLYMRWSGRHHVAAASLPGESTLSEATEHEAGRTPQPIWMFWGTDVSWSCRDSNGSSVVLSRSIFTTATALLGLPEDC